MKNLIVLSMLFLVSCSHYSADKKRDVAAVGFPARIVKVISPTKNSIEYTPGVSFSIEANAYKFGSLAAKERVVKFSIVNGDVSLKNTSKTTGIDGKIKTDVVINKYPTNIHIKLRVDNVIKNINMEVKRPLKFIGNYSLENSKFLVDRASILGSGKEKVKFQFQVKDSNSKNVDAYGLGVKLVSPDGDKIHLAEIGNGKYEKTVTIKFSKGTYEYAIEVDGKVISSKVIITVVADIVVVERFLISNKSKSGEYIVQFALKERVGGYLNSLEGVEVIPVLNGPGKYSKVTYNKEKYRFEYTFFPPSKTGNTAVGISYNGESFWAKDSFAYEYSPVDTSRIKMMISDKKIIPSGIDFVPITVEYRDENNQLIKLKNKSQYPEFEISGEGRVLELSQGENGIFEGKLQPAMGQTELKISLKYAGSIIDERDLKFNYKPAKEKLSLERHIGSMSFFNGMTFDIQNKGESWKNHNGTVAGFELENRGGNDIVPNGCASDSDSNQCQATREYEWEFSEQATQNMVMVVTDFPSDKLSKMMHGWFFFFPRKVIPSVRFSDDKSKIIVTLPTDEEVIFDAETKKIIGGVLEEGPIDLGPSRHTRKFPLVRYKGKGIILRINGRGQDARLGNWNRTKISGDFGNTGAEGVMIYKYNELTDQPDVCRAAKKDFWPQADINPIPFKYYSDKIFAEYLKSHCNFDLQLD